MVAISYDRIVLILWGFATFAQVYDRFGIRRLPPLLVGEPVVSLKRSGAHGLIVTAGRMLKWSVSDLAALCDENYLRKECSDSTQRIETPMTHLEGTLSSNAAPFFTSCRWNPPSPPAFDCKRQVHRVCFYLCYLLQTLR
jgi:hypothetical protein